jgi:hypothetical protein
MACIIAIYIPQRDIGMYICNMSRNGEHISVPTKSAENDFLFFLHDDAEWSTGDSLFEHSRMTEKSTR